MEAKIRTALASFGMSGRVFHGPLLKVLPGFEVAKVFERTKEESAGLFPKAQIVRSYEEILNDPSIELIIVNTPDSLHFDMAKQAILAGKHVVVEKPFSQTVSQARELILLAKKKGVVLTVYQNRRWDSDFRTIQKLIAEKLVGQIAEFESHYDRYRNYIAPDTWKEEGGDFGGVLFNLGPHMIDQALVLFGKPRSVSCHLAALRNGSKVADYYDIRFQYDGFAALLKCSYLVCGEGPRYIIHGTEGSFLKYGLDTQEEALKAGKMPEGENWGAEPKEIYGKLITESEGKKNQRIIPSMPGDYRQFYKNLFGAIRKGEELAVKPDEALMVIEIIEACMESNYSGKTIRVSAI